MRTALKSLALAGAVAAGLAPAALASAPNPALVQAVEARSAEARARDGARHPVETLSFFQLEPGMTVAEVLPGGGLVHRDPGQLPGC